MKPGVEMTFLKGKTGSDARIGLGVGVFVLDENHRVLLEKRADCGLWGLVGGRIEPGESILDATVREVFEETGIQVACVRLLGVYSEPEDRTVTYSDNGDVVHKIDIVVEAKMVSGALAKSSESEELRFFDLRALPLDSDICPPARRPIADYSKGFAGVIA